MKAKEHEKVHGIRETALYIEETVSIRIFKSPPRYAKKNGLNPTNNGFKPFFYAFTMVKPGNSEPGVRLPGSFFPVHLLFFVQFRPVIPVQKLLIRRCAGNPINISVPVLIDVIRCHAHINILPIGGLVDSRSP